MRIESLTFFRFIAAIIVVIYHYGKSTELSNILYPFSMSGQQMVTFFFSLSGFVLMISHYYKENETLKSFYISRLARILPLYLLGLVFMIYFEYGKNDNDLTGVFLSLTFLQSWIPPYAMSFNIPAWSLSVEIFFYLTFPLILFIIKKSKISSLKLSIYTIILYIATQILLSHLIINFTFSETLKHLIDYFPLSHYCSFLAGVTAGYIYVKNQQYFLNTHSLSVIPMLLILFILYYFFQHQIFIDIFFNTYFAYDASFYALFSVFLILSISYTKTFITKILSLPFFILLGESSYALYILQQPIYISYYTYLTPYLDLHKDLHFYLYLLILIVISILIFQLIEKPTNKLIKNLLNHKSIS